MLRHLFICTLGLFCLVQSLTAQMDGAVLENAKVRLIFATKPVPFLPRLEHKPSGTNLIARPIDDFIIAPARTGNGNRLA